MAKRALHSTLYQQPPRRARAHEQARTRRNPFLWRPLFYQHTIRRDTVLQTYGSRYKLHFVAQCDPHGLREEGVTGRRTLGRGEPTSAVPAAPRPVIAMTTAAISAQPSALHAVHSHFGSRGTPPSKGCRTSVRSAKQVRSAQPPRRNLQRVHGYVFVPHLTSANNFCHKKVYFKVYFLFAFRRFRSLKSAGLLVKKARTSAYSSDDRGHRTTPSATWCEHAVG